jgi:hypothetical protein
MYVYVYSIGGSAIMTWKLEESPDLIELLSLLFVRVIRLFARSRRTRASAGG